MSDEDEYLFEEDEDEDDDGMASEGLRGPSAGSAMFAEVPQPVKIKEKTLSPTEMLAKINEMTTDVQSVLAWSHTSSLLLLRHFRWNATALKERYFEDPDRVLAQSKISDCPDAFTKATKEAECGLCWDDVDAGDAWHLACDHLFCTGCWKNHLSFHLKNSGANSIAVRCPQKKCSQFCGEAAVEGVFGKASKEVTKYRTFLLDLFAEEDEHCRQCPTPNCDAFVLHPSHSKSTCGYVSVRCDTCNGRFCFGCAMEDHGPATCPMMVKWRKKEQDESETANWVTANTKPCPGKNCGKTVEKNGGCNHIVCPQCKHEWCWICEGDWAKHGTSWYKCNYFSADEDNKDGKVKKRDAARTELERYIHYYSRYRIHEQSKKLDKVVLRKTRERMAKALQQNSQASLVDLDYMETTAQVLVSCRHTLMFSYCYAYYLDNAKAKDLFEFNQQQLEYATEMLSEFVEDTTGKYGKQEIVNRTSTAEKMLRKLQEANDSASP